MDVCHGSFVGNAMLGYPQPNSVTGATSSNHSQPVDVNNIAPLATPLFQLPTPAISNNFSDKIPLEKPRLPVSSYAYFIQDRREMYRRVGTAVKFTDFSKECSELWGQMSNEEKEKFKALASMDKVRYQKEMDCYKKATEVKAEKRGRKKRQPGHPKRNMSAFLFFSAQKRPQLKSANPKATVGDNSKQLSTEWKKMTDKEKEPYIKMADRDKERYDQQKVAFSAGLKAGYHARSQEDDLLFGLTEDMENFNKKKDPSMPKRNMSAFMFFSCDKRPEFKKSNPGANLSALSKMLSEAWKKLTPLQRRTYETMATNDKERYRRQLASYKSGKITS